MSGIHVVLEIDGFRVTALIPDPTIKVVDNGGRCACCGQIASLTTQLCKKCKLPFVGPKHFPDFSEWETYSIETQKRLVKEAYRCVNKGRLSVQGVPCIPLSRHELYVVQNLKGEYAEMFMSHHGYFPSEICQQLSPDE